MNWLENSIYQIKEKTRCHSGMLSKVNNFKIFRIFNEKLIFLFYELRRRVHNTFMVKVGSFTVYFKIMLVWGTFWLSKKVSYDIAFTCHYDVSIVIFWLCFCDTWLLYSDKPYCIRRVTWCSYDKNCAWYNKITVILLYVMILIKRFQHLWSKRGWF